MEITNAVPPDHPEVRVSIGADAGTGATAHVRVLQPGTIPSAKTDYFPESCRFRTTVPQMRHWAGSSPHRKNMKEPALVLCSQHSFGEPKDGACVDENPRSGRYCRFARPRFAVETPVTTNAQAEPPRGFVHAPCPEQGTQSSVLSALFKKRSRKN